jgi:hypothetical protein
MHCTAMMLRRAGVRAVCRVRAAIEILARLGMAS